MTEDLPTTVDFLASNEAAGFSTVEPATLILPADLDYDAAGEIAAFLSSHCKTAIRLDASAVSQVGALAGQVLTMAARTWDEDQVTVQIDDPKGGLMKGLTALGLSEAVHSLSAGRALEDAI